MSLPGPGDKSRSQNVFQILVEFHTKRRNWEMERNRYKGCHSYHQLQPPGKLGEPWGNSRRKEYLLLTAIKLQSFPTKCPEEAQMWKTENTAPDSWGAYQRNDFSEPRLLHLPIHRKALNSLTWDIWFSLINHNLLIARLLIFNLSIFNLPFVAMLLLIYNLAPPLTSSEQFSQGYLRYCLLGLSPKDFCWIKHNSQVLGSMYFFQLSVVKVEKRLLKLKCSLEYYFLSSICWLKTNAQHKNSGFWFYLGTLLRILIWETASQILWGVALKW